jgi:hypothetical protein
MDTEKRLDAAHTLQEARRYFYQDHNYLAAATLLRDLIQHDAPTNGMGGEHYRVLAQCYHQLITFGEEEIDDSFKEAVDEGLNADELKTVIAERARWRDQAEQCLKRYEAVRQA